MPEFPPCTKAVETCTNVLGGGVRACRYIVRGGTGGVLLNDDGGCVRV